MQSSDRSPCNSIPRWQQPEAIPALRLLGLLPMPFNRTGLQNLYCVGDSCFPGQGLNAVAFSGFACAHRIGADLGLNPWKLPA
jgi:prolycopene isomerase